MCSLQELAAAAHKYNVQITCFDLNQGAVSKSIFSPKDGVIPRAHVVC